MEQSTRAKWLGWVAAFVVLIALSVIVTVVPLMVQRHGEATGMAMVSRAEEVASAISAYQVEYGRLPGPPGADAEIPLTGLLHSSLSGASHAGPDYPNPREIVFLAYSPFLDVDAWGVSFRVRIDGDYDGRIEDPENPGEFIDAEALVWSAGEDGDFATEEDNYRSW